MPFSARRERNAQLTLQAALKASLLTKKKSNKPTAQFLTNESIFTSRVS